MGIGGEADEEREEGKLRLWSNRVGDGAGGESKAEREKTEVGYVLPLCFLLAAVVTKPTRDGG